MVSRMSEVYESVYASEMLTWVYWVQTVSVQRPSFTRRLHIFTYSPRAITIAVGKVLSDFSFNPVLFKECYRRLLGSIRYRDNIPVELTQ